MRILFDTSVAIGFRDGDPIIRARSRSVDPVALLSILTVVELEGGAAGMTEAAIKRRRALDEMYQLLDILPFCLDEATAYRDIVGALGFSRPKIVDRMIAAQAIVADATLVTLNARDFRTIPGLNLEDWSE